MSEDCPFNIGDVVVLNSGSPKMTVTDCDPDDALCKWFAGNKFEEEWFPVDSLRLSEDREELTP